VIFRLASGFRFHSDFGLRVPDFTSFPPVFAPIEGSRGPADVWLRMKRPLEEAAELFRGNEALAGGDREKANLYRGLTQLVEGLRRLEKGLAEAASDSEGGSSHFYQRRPARTLRRAARAFRAVRTGEKL
jgi:hypothetical protein